MQVAPPESYNLEALFRTCRQPDRRDILQAAQLTREASASQLLLENLVSFNCAGLGRIFIS